MTSLPFEGNCGQMTQELYLQRTGVRMSNTLAGAASGMLQSKPASTLLSV